MPILIVSFFFFHFILKRIKRRNEIFIFHRYRPVYLPMVIIWIFSVTRDILRMNERFLSFFLFLIPINWIGINMDYQTWTRRKNTSITIHSVISPIH